MLTCEAYGLGCIVHAFEKNSKGCKIPNSSVVHAFERDIANYVQCLEIERRMYNAQGLFLPPPLSFSISLLWIGRTVHVFADEDVHWAQVDSLSFYDVIE